jgi:hypothetical protein
MAYANPVTRKEQTYEFNPTIDKRSFKFLLSSRFLDELQTIANTLDFWTPDENMYLKERIYDGNISLYCPIYIHMALEWDLLDEDGDYVDDPLNVENGNDFGKQSLIPNLSYKWKKIIADWEDEIKNPDSEWGYDKDGGPADWVEAECEGKEGFLAWLFGDNSIESTSDLTEEQNEVYENFMFDELDKEGLSPSK